MATVWPGVTRDNRTFFWALIWAFVLEFSAIAVIGWQGHWIAHPKTDPDESRFIEAQIFEMPPDAHLVEEKKPKAAKARETVLSKVPQKGREHVPGEKPIQEENQTENGPALSPTHGPVAIFAPQPVIPEYLRDKDLNASVVIDFYVNAQGVSTPKLAGSSGNEELDALALETAQKWQFRAGEKDHKPIDSKIRLRIVFEVH